MGRRVVHVPKTRAVVPTMQNMAFCLPVVKVTDNRYTFSIGSPDTKLKTGLAILLCYMSTKILVETTMGTLTKKVNVMLIKKGMRKYSSFKIYRAPPGSSPLSRDSCVPVSRDRLKGGLEPSLSWPA